jgi:hypothetical protein
MTQVTANWDRTVVVSIDKKTGHFVQLKLFKKFMPHDFIQRIQQVSLRRVEAEKIFFQLDLFYNAAMKLLQKQLIPLLNFTSFMDDINQDVDSTHWYMDVHTSEHRIVRVSLAAYDVLTPIVSTYFQIKVFKPDNEGNFKRQEYVAMTLQELNELKNMHLNPSKFKNF